MTTKLAKRGRTIIRICLVALAAALGVVVLRPKPPRPPATITTVAELDTYLTALTAFGTPPGLSLAVVKDGAVVYERGFGQADTPQQRAAGPETVYGWWSMTKLMTAVAVLQLQEQGKLNIDDPVSAYVPFFTVTYPSDSDQQVTIRHLLNHSSGLPNNVPALVGWIHHAEEPRLDQTAYLAEVLPDYAKLRFAPGDHGEYTNVGYMVLGAVIEAASGQTYEDYVRSHLLQPLGMAHTGLHLHRCHTGQRRCCLTPLDVDGEPCLAGARP